jgi:multiple sugar transport system permease protein
VSTVQAAQPAVTRDERIVVPYRRISVSAVATNIALILLGGFFVLPMLWMLFASVDSNPDWAIRLPSLTLSNYIDVLTTAGALTSFRASLILAGTTTVVTTVLAMLAAYPLSRHHIPLRRTFMLLILFASGLPVSMLLVPVYQLYVTLGWFDSLYTTALFLAASSLPFAIWLMKNFIDAVPEDLEHAAAIDGASTFRILRQVILPLTLPGIAVTSIYTFINAWGAFLIPFVLNSNPDDQPGPIEIYNFMGSHGLFKFGDLAVFSLLFSLPVVALYLFMSRYFSGAFNFSGAVRG